MLLVLEHSDSAPSQRLGERLIQYGHRLRVLRLHRGDQVPDNLNGIDGLISCGGEQSANDDGLSWLDAEMELMRAAHAHALPVVGICLGCQILARSLGGEVKRMAGGIELGWHSVALNPVGCEDVLHAGIAWSSMQPHWHRDEVTKPPPDARVLASSARCKVQTWALGLRTYGIQYHPEIGPQTLERWAAQDPGALREAGTTSQRLAEETRQHYPAAARLADRLFENMALMLMPVDRRYRGVVKDLHH